MTAGPPQADFDLLVRCAQFDLVPYMITMQMTHAAQGTVLFVNAFPAVLSSLEVQRAFGTRARKLSPTLFAAACADLCSVVHQPARV